KTYDSLYDYYRAAYPKLRVTPNTPVALVSFSGRKHPQPVAADRLWARVMNDALPWSLRDVDKLTPQERRDEIVAFWKEMGDDPFGGALGLSLLAGFWRPEADRVRQIAFPGLEFGKGFVQSPPSSETADAYKDHYRQRLNNLNQYGCYGWDKT